MRSSISAASTGTFAFCFNSRFFELLACAPAAILRGCPGFVGCLLLGPTLLGLGNLLRQVIRGGGAPLQRPLHLDEMLRYRLDLGVGDGDQFPITFLGVGLQVPYPRGHLRTKNRLLCSGEYESIQLQFAEHPVLVSTPYADRTGGSVDTAHGRLDLPWRVGIVGFTYDVALFSTVVLGRQPQIGSKDDSCNHHNEKAGHSQYAPNDSAPRRHGRNSDRHHHGKRDRGDRRQPACQLGPGVFHIGVHRMPTKLLKRTKEDESSGTDTDQCDRVPGCRSLAHRSIIAPQDDPGYRKTSSKTGISAEQPTRSVSPLPSVAVGARLLSCQLGCFAPRLPRGQAESQAVAQSRCLFT